MSRKLALYFVNQEESRPYVLDARYQPVNASGVPGWSLGRQNDCDIIFPVSRHPDYRYVSKEHMRIKAVLSTNNTESGSVKYDWFARESVGNANSTYMFRYGGFAPPFKLTPDKDYLLEEGDRLQLGAVAATILVSFDIDETEQIVPEASVDVTANNTQVGAGIRQSPYWVNDIFNPVWFWYTDKNSVEQFFYLLFIGGLVALIAYAWKS